MRTEKKKIMATREVYRVDQNTGKSIYAGYASFDDDGNFKGTRGGYGKNGNLNNLNNGGSKVQNTIATAGARQAKRARQAFGR